MLARRPPFPPFPHPPRPPSPLLFPGYKTSKAKQKDALRRNPSTPQFHAWLQGTYVFRIPRAPYILLHSPTRLKHHPPFAAATALPTPSPVRYDVQYQSLLINRPPALSPNTANPPSSPPTHTQTMLRHHSISTPDNTTSPTPPHQHCPPPSIIWPHRHSKDYRRPDRIAIDGFPPT